MRLLIPGGPGLPENSMLKLKDLCGKDCAVLGYSAGASGINDQDTIDKIVMSGIEILNNFDPNERVLVGHSFGGLIAKEISNR